MDSTKFVASMQERVAEFCKTLEARPPAYSYIPLESDAQRVAVMRCRLLNEMRAAEIFGGWLATTPELEVKYFLGASVGEELEHARLLAATLRARGVDPFDYTALPAQVIMLGSIEAMTSTIERLAAFSLATEGVATVMIERMLADASVPEWVREPYRTISVEEASHASVPAEAIARYATTAAQQGAVARAVDLGLDLRRRFFADIDRWVSAEATV